MAEALLTLQDILVQYGEAPILEVPSMAVHAGEVLAVIGPNGAGKSTLLRVMGLLEQPIRGRVTFQGQEVTRDNALTLRRCMASVFQEPLLLNTSVYENATLGLKLRGLDRQTARQRVRPWLERLVPLAHEAGHSMHSYYSAKHQPYEYYSYTIFVAEVASTFNEQLLSRFLMQRAKDDRERAYLINREIDAIRGTIIRQTMFAEFEKITHALCEAGEPLTVECLKREYGKLLELYFGPDFVIDDELRLECLRIPHFYSAFYVYKYATGLSAAIALSERVTSGGKRELDDYLSFLKGGCSKWPLELLADAGVDMTSPAPVETALAHFERLVRELDELL